VRVCVQTSGLGGSGIDTSRLLTANDTLGYNASLYMLTVRVSACAFASLLRHSRVRASRD
jgi:hypothetical protein